MASTVTTPVTPATLTRTLTLRAGQPSLSLSYELRNVGYLPPTRSQLANRSSCVLLAIPHRKRM